MLAKFVESIGGIPVVDGDRRLVGIVTNRDLRFQPDNATRLDDIMTREGLVTAPIGTTLDQAEDILQRHKIEKLEHAADDLKKEIRLHLPKSLFMPVPREDLLELLLVQDKIANRTRDVSGVIMGRKMSIPEPIADKFLEFVDSNIGAAKQARTSVRELDELFTAGFKGAEVDLIADLIEELDQMETDTDRKQTEIRSALFAIEKTLDPVDAIFLYEVIELTGDIADMAERVGRRLELLLS